MMPLERAELLINQGMEAAFVGAMAARALPLLRALAGAKSVALGRGVENPDKFLLLIDWATMDAHAAFSRNPVHQEFRAILAPFTRGGAMEHFEMS